MRRYKFKLQINEVSDEFWESIKGTGIDEITKHIKEILYQNGLQEGDDFELKLVSFSDSQTKG